MKKKIYPFYFVIGALLVYSLFLVLPGVIGLGYAFTDWSSYGGKLNFIGLQNFKDIFLGKEHYLSFLSNSIVFTIISTALKLVLSVVLALILNEGIRLKNFHRAVIFIPAILSMLITGLIFKSVLNPQTGILNEALRSVGLGALAKQWLVNPKYAFGSIIGVDAWKGIGYLMTIILAGLQSISPEYYEAADIDGASYLKKLRYITLPMIRPAMVIEVVLGIFYGLKVFDIVYVLTNGGPGYATSVVSTSVYSLFGSGNWGLGSALNSLLFVFMIVVGFFTVRLLNPRDGEF
jgi:raffinose/stachyose/melibiose transport system permease protein